MAKCENAVEIKNFKYFLCAKKMTDGKDYSKTENKVEAMCYNQELCEVCPGHRMLPEYVNCALLKEKNEEIPDIKTEEKKEEAPKPKKKGKK